MRLCPILRMASQLLCLKTRTDDPASFADYPSIQVVFILFGGVFAYTGELKFGFGSTQFCKP